MWSGLSQETASNAVGANPAYAIYKVFQEEGMKALFAGFVPRNLFIAFIGATVYGIYEKNL